MLDAPEGCTSPGRLAWQNLCKSRRASLLAETKADSQWKMCRRHSGPLWFLSTEPPSHARLGVSGPPVRTRPRSDRITGRTSVDMAARPPPGRCRLSPGESREDMGTVSGSLPLGVSETPHCRVSCPRTSGSVSFHWIQAGQAGPKAGSRCGQTSQPGSWIWEGGRSSQARPWPLEPRAACIAGQAPRRGVSHQPDTGWALLSVLFAVCPLLAAWYDAGLMECPFSLSPLQSHGSRVGDNG